MTAFIAGRTAVEEAPVAEPAPATKPKGRARRVVGGKPAAGGERDKPSQSDSSAALNAIAATIPVEGIAFYVAFYGLFVATIDQTLDGWRAPLAFLIVAGAIAVNIIFVISASYGGYHAMPKRGKGRRRAARYIFFRSIAFSLLCIIYIAGTPDNPFVVYTDFALLAGTTIATFAAFVIGTVGKVRDLIAAPLKPKPEPAPEPT